MRSHYVNCACTRHIAIELGIDFEKHGPVRSWLNIYDGKGIGYARSTDEELAFLIQVARSSGVTLDPVYSGKGLFYFARDVVKARPDLFRPSQSILFVHTGGSFGLAEKSTQIMALLDPNEIKKMVVVRKA